jgi:hypothetical protein
LPDVDIVVGVAHGMQIEYISLTYTCSGMQALPVLLEKCAADIYGLMYSHDAKRGLAFGPGRSACHKDVWMCRRGCV